MKQSTTKNLVLAALFAALIFLGTFIIRIPIPATNGYIHFGDGFIYITAIILPAPYAAAAAAIGGLLSDVLAGYAFYAPWTAIIKALMALVLALLLRRNPFISRLGGQKAEGEPPAKGLGMAIAASVIAGLVNICGYFVVECLMYTPAGAIISAPMNALQSAFGVIVFFVLGPVFARALHAISK